MSCDSFWKIGSLYTKGCLGIFPCSSDMTVSQSPFYFNYTMSSSAQVSFQTLSTKDHTEPQSSFYFKNKIHKHHFSPWFPHPSVFTYFNTLFTNFNRKNWLLCFPQNELLRIAPNHPIIREREREITCHFSYRKAKYADWATVEELTKGKILEISKSHMYLFFKYNFISNDSY